MLGRVVESDDEGPSIPFEVAHLWDYFNDIVYGLQPGFGPAVVTWESVRAWCELSGITLDPWEVRALIALGVMRASVLGEKDT